MASSGPTARAKPLPSWDKPMVKLADKEGRFLEQNKICRLATSSKNGELHIVPVSYIWHEETIYVVTDYGTRKLRNLRENPNAAILVDTNATRKAVLVSGKVQLVEEGEAPFVKIAPTFKTSWGLGK